MDVAPDGGHTEAIAVATNAADHAVDEGRGLWMLHGAKAQEVHGGDGPSAHGEDIPQDAADASGRPLVGLDEAGVVVALHLESDCPTVVDTGFEVDDAGVFARPHDDPRPLGGEAAEVGA